MMATKQFRLNELIDGLDVTIKGDANCLVTGISRLESASPGHITFLTNPLYRKFLNTTKASVVILSEADLAACPVHAVVSSNPHYVYAKIAAHFVEKSVLLPGVHPSAVVDERAIIHPSAAVAPNCTIGNGVVVARYVEIGANCVLGDFVEIGEGSKIEPLVAIHHHVKIGKRNKIASGAVIGSDGFGFAQQKKQWHTVPQLGSVILGDDVDIGANTTIDCGALGDTIIEDGVKLDNLIQVGHNVRIGAHSIIAGCVAIAGSVEIGKYCMVGGGTCFAGHISIVDNTIITGMTAVTKSISNPGIYSSGIVGAVPNAEFKKNNARFHRLENLIDRVKSLELTVKALTKRE